MKQQLFERAGELESQGSPFALVTILKTTGSASRSRGTMLVEANGAITSTIGGGLLEAQVIQEAQKAIAQDQGGYSMNFVIDQEAQKATGKVTVFIQPVVSKQRELFFARAKTWEEQGLPFLYGFSLTEEGKQFFLTSEGECIGTCDTWILPHAETCLSEGLDQIVSHNTSSYFLALPLPLLNLLLVGGGHVNQALATLAKALGYGFQVVEYRSEYATKDLFQGSRALHVAPTIREALLKASVDRFTYTVIASHSFAQEALDYLLETPSPYIGILGSKLKARMLQKNQSVPTLHQQRVFCPIGLAIGSETPMEIAISVLAQIMQQHSGSSGRALRDEL